MNSLIIYLPSVHFKETLTVFSPTQVNGAQNNLFITVQTFFKISFVFCGRKSLTILEKHEGDDK